MICLGYHLPRKGKNRRVGGRGVDWAFAVWDDHITQRRPSTLPCAATMAHREGQVFNVCFSIQHMVQDITTSTHLSSNLSLPWATPCTRQSFAVCFFVQHTTKAVFFLIRMHITKTLFVVPTLPCVFYRVQHTIKPFRG